MKQNFRILLISVFLMICSISAVLAASVTIVPSGGNTFVVQGGDMNGVAGIDLNISYDASSLASPSVNQGALVSGAMFLANANNPGNIKIAIVSTKVFSGNGPIATITFGSQTGNGSISSVTAKMININGGNMAVQASVVPAGTTPPPEPESTATAVSGTVTTQSASTVTGAGSATTSSASTATQGVSSSLGTISLPQDTQPSAVAAVKENTTVVQPQAPAVPVQSVKVPDSAPAAIESEIAVAASVQTNFISIPERFRVYQGARTPVAMTGLFQKQITDSVRQEPTIVVSDGKSNFKLFLALSSGSTSAPNFALTGAKLVALKNAGGPGRWLVEATPEKNAQKVSVTIVTGGSFVEYPVTSVPPIALISGKEADFADFLKDSGAKMPRFDLNGDGKHDYLDDYIYTGHYLILKGAGRK
jgi:Cohesin domain